MEPDETDPGGNERDTAERVPDTAEPAPATAEPAPATAEPAPATADPLQHLLRWDETEPAAGPEPEGPGRVALASNASVSPAPPEASIGGGSWPSLGHPRAAIGPAAGDPGGSWGPQGSQPPPVPAGPTSYGNPTWPPSSWPTGSPPSPPPPPAPGAGWSWGPPHPYGQHPWEQVSPPLGAQPTWTYAAQAPRAPRRPPRSLPGWLGVGLVAAVVGAVVGGGVAVTLTSRSQQTVVQQYFHTNPVTVRPGDIQAILAKVMPAVVSIDTSSYRGAAGLDFVQGAGTGMIIEPTGVVLTNNHVIARATSVTVTLYGQTHAYPAKVIGTEPSKDIALVQIEGAGDSLPVVHFGDSNRALQGDGVLAIGNALALAGGPTVTEGIVSAKNRSFSAETDYGTTENLTGLIQTDAPINPGNSGGPLVDSAGLVVAMNTAVATSSQGNAPAQNVGFAIAIDEVRPIIRQLLEAAGRH